MLAKQGVDLKVWSYDKIKNNNSVSKLFGEDEPINTDLSAIEPDKRHEPVLPISSRDAQLAEIINGGVNTTGDLLWMSTEQYPVNSIVKLSTQEGTYKVTGYSSYRGYSDYIAYSLKRDARHDSD